MKCCARCFSGSLGTSMDFPNLHRKLFKGGADAYTRPVTQRLREAQAAGLEIGVIAVLHQGSLDAGPDAFYRYYTEELGLERLSGQHAFPRRTGNEVEAEFDLDKPRSPNFSPASSISGWSAAMPTASPSVPSTPHPSLHRRARAAAVHLEGELFQPIHLRRFQRHRRAMRLLGDQLPGVAFSATSFATPISRECCAPARRGASLSSDRSISSNTRTASHAASLHLPRRLPRRTYSALGTMLAKDPYCEVYKAVFGRAEIHGRTIYGVAMLRLETTVAEN